MRCRPIDMGFLPQAYHEYVGFVLAMNERVKGKKLTDDFPVSEVSICRRLPEESSPRQLSRLRQSIRVCQLATNPTQDTRQRIGRQRYEGETTGTSIHHLLGVPPCRFVSGKPGESVTTGAAWGTRGQGEKGARDGRLPRGVPTAPRRWSPRVRLLRVWLSLTIIWRLNTIGHVIL